MSSMSAALGQVVESWLQSSTALPLTLVKSGDDVQVIKGTPKPRMTKTQAAVFLGISRPTLYSKYIHTKRLAVGKDGLICCRAAQRLLDDLSGR